MHNNNMSVYRVVRVLKIGIMASMECIENCSGVFQKLKVAMAFLK